MALIMTCLLVTIGVFGGICLHLAARIDDEHIKREIQNITIDYLVKRVDQNKECIELQTKCIRDLNNIVKITVKDKETAEPDTKALISGWDADEPELLQQLISKEEWMQLAKANSNCQRLEPLPPPQWSQLTFYPWQQTPSGAILPLWYINRRLEDM